MADVNLATAPAVQPIVIGNKLLTPGADGKTVQVSEKDGSNAQSMDLAEFKKYLEAHKEEIIAASKQNASDTVNFKGKEEQGVGEAPPEKKGLSTGTLLLGAAALVGIGVWQHKTGNLQKGWEIVKGWFNKKTTESTVEDAIKATKEGKLTPEAKKIKEEVAEALKPKENYAKKAVDKSVSEFETSEEMNKTLHAQREAELTKAFEEHYAEQGAKTGNFFRANSNVSQYAQEQRVESANNLVNEFKASLSTTEEKAHSKRQKQLEKAFSKMTITA